MERTGRARAPARWNGRSSVGRNRAWRRRRRAGAGKRIRGANRLSATGQHGATVTLVDQRTGVPVASRSYREEGGEQAAWRALRGGRRAGGLAGLVGSGGPARTDGDAGRGARGARDRAGDRGTARRAHHGADQRQLRADARDPERAELGAGRGAQLGGSWLEALAPERLREALEPSLHAPSATAAVPACAAGLPHHARALARRGGAVKRSYS